MSDTDEVIDITPIQAEALLGHRVDRRRKYWRQGDQVLVEIKWVGSCTGCYESEDGYPCGEYPVHPKHLCYIGAGCDECGYHGVVRQGAWVPYFNPRDKEFL